MKKIKLGDISSKIGSGATPRGGKNTYEKIGVAFIRSQNVRDFYFDYNQLVFINDNQARQLSNVEVQDKDILLNITGDSITRCTVVPENILPARVSQHVSIIRCRDEINSKYVMYQLQYLKNYLLSLCKIGGTRNALTKEMITDLPIDLPPREMQERIAALLGALDCKIALNKKINATLEAMAKTLYDYWFVQFDFPNEHGRPYKSSGGKMVYSSELGREIPKSWTVATLGDLITENATPFNSQTAEPTIDLSVMPSASISLDRLNISSMFSINLFKMTEGDILFGSIRPYLKKAGIAPCDGVVVGTVHSYRAKKESDYTFALFTICHDNFFDYAVKVSTGTRMPIISSESLLSYKVAYSENIAKIFNMPDLRRTICKNVQESQRLAELRDWLLPLLMNGQVNCK